MLYPAALNHATHVVQVFLQLVLYHTFDDYKTIFTPDDFAAIINNSIDIVCKFLLLDLMYHDQIECIVNVVHNDVYTVNK